MASTYLKIPGSNVEMRAASAVPNADALVGASQVSSAPVVQQPYAMTGAPPTPTPMSASGSLSALGSMTGSVSPSAFISPDEIKPPSMMENASDWLTQNKGQFVSAMGMLSTHFAQTPGQREAGAMIQRSGAMEMEQQRKDKAAQELGFSSSEALAAAKEKQGIDTAKAQETAMLEEANLTKFKVDFWLPEDIKVKQQEIKKLQQEGKYLEAKTKSEALVEKTLKDGSKMTIKAGDEIELHKLVIEAKRVEAQAKLMGAQMGDYEKVNVPGIGDVPAHLATQYLGATRVAQIHDATARYVVDQTAAYHRDVAEITKAAALGKLDDKGIESARKTILDLDKITAENASMMFTKDEKGKTVLRSNYTNVLEPQAIAAAVLIKSGNDGDKALGRMKLGSLIDMTPDPRKKAEYGLLMQGILPSGTALPAPGPAPGPAAPPEAVPKPSSYFVPSMSQYGLGPASTYPKGVNDATEQWIKSAFTFPKTAAERLRKDFYAGPKY